MVKILLLLLTIAAIGLTIFYAAIYESSIPGATYQDTYAVLSLGAAIIFSGLLYGLTLNKAKNESTLLFNKN
jgi:hypothetical protein